MPVRDLYHDLVRRLLEADGWNITHDPLVLRFGKRAAFVDLGAMAGERDGEKIAVEIKGQSVTQLADLERAVGQFALYGCLLGIQDPERTLDLAIPKRAFDELMLISEFRALKEQINLKLLVFDTKTEAITEWIR